MDKRFWLACVVVAALAFTVRIALTVEFVGLNAPPDESAQPDQVDYELYAWRMAQGLGMTLADGTPTASVTPGTSLALLPVYVVFGRDFAAGRIWFCLLSAMTCVATAWTGRLMRNATTGLIAGAMLAVYPNHAYYAMHFVSEVPGAFLAMLATGATIVSLRRGASTAAACLAGVLWGSAALMRPNMLLALPALAVPALVPRWRLNDWRKGLPQLVVIGIATSVVLMPVIVRNQRVMGFASLSTGNATTFWGANNHRILERAPGGWLPASALVDAEHPINGSEVEQSAQMWTYSRAFLIGHVGSLPYLAAMKLLQFLTPFLETENRLAYWAFAAGWLVAALLLIPGAWWAFRENATTAWIAAAPLVAIVLTTLVYYGSIRFRDSVAANYMLFAAVAIARWLGRPGSSSREAAGARALSIVV